MNKYKYLFHYKERMKWIFLSLNFRITESRVRITPNFSTFLWCNIFVLSFIFYFNCIIQCNKMLDFDSKFLYFNTNTCDLIWFYAFYIQAHNRKYKNINTRKMTSCRIAFLWILEVHGSHFPIYLTACGFYGFLKNIKCLTCNKCMRNLSCKWKLRAKGKNF